MFKTSGKLVYSPKSHLKQADKWLVLMLDDEISKYYRHLYEKTYPIRNSGFCQKLTRPVWGPHVSIIRNEQIPNQQAWGFAANKMISIEYEGGVKSNNEYFWLDVYSDELSAIRELMGLSRTPKWGFHMTVGRST